MSGSTHIIGKQHFRFRYKGKADALAIRNQLSTMCNDELPVRLNKLFDDYDQADQVLRIDKLDVKVVLTDTDNLKEALVKAILSQVEIALKSKLQEPGTSSLSFDKSFMKALDFYLVRGFLPWWVSTKTSQAFLLELETHWSLEFIEKMLVFLRPALASEAARSRFLALINKSQWKILVEQATRIHPSAWEDWLDELQILGTCLLPLSKAADLERFSCITILEWIVVKEAPLPDFVTFQGLFFQKLAQKGIIPNLEIINGQDPAFLSPMLRKAFQEWKGLLKILAAVPEANQKPEAPINNKVSEKKSDLSPDSPGILIHNSGMVILAPFLPEFFRRLKLIENNAITDLSKAMAMLRQLSWGKSECLEFELVLEKTLCGIDLSETVESLVPLNDTEIAACEELLQAVIENWSVLKNTSPDGLRMNFLQREGKLEMLEQQKTLIIQKEAHDILLDYLPWNINMIKLPWMDQLLNVKWR